MVKLKNIRHNYQIFLVIITLTFGLVSCKTQNHLSTIHGKRIPVGDNLSEDPAIVAFIQPYKSKLDAEMNEVLCDNPTTLDKSKLINPYQSEMGNWMSDVVFDAAKLWLQKKHQLTLDGCLLNHGGIRAILPAGKVQTKNAFEIMPFENSLVVVALKGTQVKHMVEMIYSEKKPHPLSGVKAIKNGDSIEISINNEVLNPNKIYYIATSDYTANGGDNMTFFLENKGVYDLDYKLRNILIDYFKKTNSVTFSRDIRLQ